MAKRNQKPLFIWVTLLVVAVAVAVSAYFIYQSNSDSTAQNSAKQPQPAEPTTKDANTKKKVARTGTTITTGNSEFGPMLFDSKKQAIYIWEVEKSSTPECYGDCEAAWPPVLTDGAPVASGDVDGKLLGTTERTDGTSQVTYNDHPLYYYAHEGPGEVKCHNVATHGGLWWVVQPNGNRAE